MKRLIASLFVAFAWGAETKPNSASDPKATATKATATVTRRTTRVVVVAPIRSRYRYTGLFNLLGSGVNAMWDSTNAEWNSGRFYDQGIQEAPEATPYIEPVSTLLIESNPPGAEVFIDAKSFGPAPVSASVRPGLRYVAIRTDGFETWSKEIDARNGEAQKLTAELKKTAENLNVIVVKPFGN